MKPRQKKQKNNKKNASAEVKVPKKRGRKRIPGKRYFTNITELAILAYNRVKDDDYKRNKIFVRFIYKPLDKMVEILINKYKYPHIKLSYEDLKHTVMAHVIEKLHMYRASAGKAFSYFNRVAKNWLIQNNQKEYKKTCIHDNVDEIETDRNVPGEYYSNSAKEFKKQFLEEYTDFIEQNLGTFFNNKRDLAIADSIILLIRERELIENFNKKALYILIRERCRLSDKDTQYITKVLNTLKEEFNKRLRDYHTTGVIEPLPQNLFFRDNYNSVQQEII